MKAFILTAGHGTRLQPLTYDCPKPMLPVMNKPVLEHIVKHLAKYGVTDIMMNPGYKGELIENYFGDGEQLGVSISYLPEMIETPDGFEALAKGSASTLAIAQHFYQFFDEPVLVLCGDAIIDLDIQQAMASHKESGSIASVFLQTVSAADAHKYGIAKVNAFNRITQFVEKPKMVGESEVLANTGVYIFDPEAIDEIDSFNGMDIGGDLLPKLVEQSKRVMGFDHPYRWFDIGTVSDFKSVSQRMLLEASIEKMLDNQQALEKGESLIVHQGKCCRVEGNITGPVVMGNGCIIEEGATVAGNVVLGNNCVVRKGAYIENSVVLPYSEIARGHSIVDAIITPHYQIEFSSDGEYFVNQDGLNGSSRDYFQSTEQETSFSIAA